MNKKRITLAVTAILLVMVGAAWALGMFHRTDPQVAELQQMRDQLFANRDVPREQRGQQFTEFRQKLESLSEDQRREVWESGQQQFMQMAQKRMDEFFALSHEEQQKRLDEIIDRMVARQKERAQNPQADRGPGGGRGGWQNMTEAQREQRSKERLDRTTPKMRAQFSQFRQMLNDRMAARGIPQDQMGGGFRGAWGRG
jgi:hypothetical protein